MCADEAALVGPGRRNSSGRTVHGLVHCAGITWRARLGDVTPEAFTRVQNVNVLGPLLGIQAVSPLMPAGGSIVIIGSLAALQGHYPVAYTTSKWAVRGLTHSRRARARPPRHPGQRRASGFHRDRR